ncbi:MAG: substrate-binding periplasmic protein [Desulfovibrio sp.]
MKNRWLALCVVFVTALFIAFGSKESLAGVGGLEGVLDKEKPIELVTLDYRPYSYTDDGELVGLNIEIVKEAFSRAGYEVSIKVVPWARGLYLVGSGQVDGMFPVISTPERVEKMMFCRQPIMIERVVLFVRSGESISYNGDLMSLKDRSFGVVNGFSYGKRFDEYSKTKVISHIDASASIQTNFRKLLDHRFDILLNEHLAALSVLDEMGARNEVTVLSPPLESSESFIVFAKSPKYINLSRKVDSALRQMTKDGTTARLLSRYLR